jgi:two-component system, LytTR family, sensor histidine kinase AlgZ
MSTPRRERSDRHARAERRDRRERRDPRREPSGLADALPDFRNLGVMARILVIVNVAMLVVASLAADRAGQFVPAILQAAMVVEPALILALVALYVLNRLLRKLSYTAGVMGVGTIALLSAEASLRLAYMVGATPTPFEHLRVLLFAVLVTLVLVEYFRLRNRALSPAIAEARLQALQARIRPHFLFNSMNAMLSIIRTDPRRAEQAIEDLADLFRTLMADNSKLTTLGREIDLVRDYLRIEQLRLGDRLVVQWKIEGTPEQAMVPPLFLQPLVENAVYHGVEPSRRPGRVEIEVRRVGDRIHLRLTNPYHPEHQGRQGNRMALANIRERLALHFDVEARLEAAPDGDRYEIEIELPYRPQA